MYCHCGTNNRAPRWTFTDPCKPEVRPGAREESASPAWLAEKYQVNNRVVIPRTVDLTVCERYIYYLQSKFIFMVLTFFIIMVLSAKAIANCLCYVI